MLTWAGHKANFAFNERRDPAPSNPSSLDRSTRHLEPCTRRAQILKLGRHEISLRVDDEYFKNE